MVYEAIRQGILDGEYPAGYRLVFDQLAQDFGVSAVPVREAARRLEAEGLVEFTPNRGAQIARIDTREYRETLETLAYLEGTATAMSAANMDQATLESAKSLNTQMSDLLESGTFLGPLFSKLNGQFHERLCSHAGNTHLMDLLVREQQRMTLIRRGGYSVDTTRATASVAEHANLLNLIEAHASFEEIEKAAREHKLNTVRYYVDHQST
jgi:DNA-binding GntR family transcriptional regulator